MESYKINISLNPVPSSVTNHKFMVQIVETDMVEGDTGLGTFWQNIKKIDKSKIESHKLKVMLGALDIIAEEPDTHAAPTEKMERFEPHNEQSSKYNPPLRASVGEDDNLFHSSLGDEGRTLKMSKLEKNINLMKEKVDTKLTNITNLRTELSRLN